MENKILSNLPIPVVRDKNGKLTHSYSSRDWFLKLQEEIFEVMEVSKAVEEYKEISLANEYKLARLESEIADVITVCFSWLECLGVREKERSELFASTNRKNFARGYIEPLKKETSSEAKTTKSILEEVVNLLQAANDNYCDAEDAPESASITIPSGTKVDKISTSSSKFKSIDNIVIYEDGTVIVNMLKK